MTSSIEKADQRRGSRLAAAIETAGVKILSRPIIEDVFRGIFGHQPDATTIADLSLRLRGGMTVPEMVKTLHASMIVEELYQGILQRAPDPNGGNHWRKAFEKGRPIREAINRLLDSDEFRGLRGRAIKQSELPDIRTALPRPYVTQTGLDSLVHHVLHIEHDSEFDLLERLIVEHRFYDSFGGWGYTIDLDKRVTAAMAKGLGARTCLDIGCSNGPVISLLAGEGVDVAGIDMSHLAFAMAYPAIRNRMLYGDLLAIDLDRTFDVVIAMDFFEHTNPRKLEKYLARAASLVDRDGYVIVNGPMFGVDRVFGQPFPLFLEPWVHEPQDRFWRHIPCYENGWPVDGHLIWASVGFWEEQFANHGLIRDIEIEASVQRALSGFFAEYAPGRKMLFVLRLSDNRRNPKEVAASVCQSILAVDGLPKPR